MQVTTKITVDLTRQNVGQRVNAVQGDGNTRQVEITLLSGGVPWTPPEGVDAAIAYMQPGGTKGLYNKLADGTAAISMAGSVATIILAPQMLTVSGTVQASLVFNDAALNRLTTFPFSVCVASNPSAGAQKVEDYLRLQWLEDKLDEYVKKITEGLAPGGSGGAVSSVNGKTGAVVLTAGDVHALPDNTIIPTVPEMVSAFENDAGYLTEHQDISGKVDKVAGKGLSTHDYDDAAKAKVDAIPEDPKYTDTVYDDTEVKQGLSQIKDDLANKLPKSPAEWGPWTAEEQAAARDRMGVTGDYELVDTITIDEDSVLDFTFPYPCKNVLIIGKVNKFASKTSYGAFRINRNVNYPAPFDGIPNTYTTNTEWSVEIMTNGSYITIINMRSDNRYLCGVQKSTKHLSAVQSISSLQSSNEFLAGTELIVYGVRA